MMIITSIIESVIIFIALYCICIIFSFDNISELFKCREKVEKLVRTPKTIEAVYRKIPDISPGLILFQSLFLGAYNRGAYIRGLITGRTFASKKRITYLYIGIITAFIIIRVLCFSTTIMVDFVIILLIIFILAFAFKLEFGNFIGCWKFLNTFNVNISIF